MTMRAIKFSGIIFILVALVILFVPVSSAYAGREIIKNFEDDYRQKLILERVTVPGVVDLGMQRIEVRTDSGRIVAYTPTRITALPFCPSAEFCWVFMWKTVYPLPAIFKFSTDRNSWTSNPHPLMLYSRNGNDGEGFIKTTNPVFGLWGVLLLIKEKIEFFSIFMLLSAILFIQINKFRDLPKIQQLWIRRILFLITAPIPIPLIPMEPFMITSMLIFFGSWMSVDLAGIPSVLSMLVAITTFFFCSMIVAHLSKRRKVAL